MSVDQGRDEQDSETNDSQPLNKTERVGSEIMKIKHTLIIETRMSREKFRDMRRLKDTDNSLFFNRSLPQTSGTSQDLLFCIHEVKEAERRKRVVLSFDMREETVDIRKSNLCNTHCLDWRIMMCITCRSLCNECFINKNPSSCRLLHDTYIRSGAEIKTTERMKEQTHMKSITIFFSKAINERENNSLSFFPLIPLLSFPSK